MYDPLRNRFRLSCPVAGRPQEVALSGFRSIGRLAGASHPPLYRVAYGCPGCRGEHVTIVTERQLDCEPVTATPDMMFLNVLTGRRERVASELLDLAERFLRHGNWPWTFYCACEHEVLPGYPSQLARLVPSDDSSLLGIAVRCASCGMFSINLVSRRHVDEPFFHDRVLRFVEQPLPAEADVLARFHAELWSNRFDEERNRFAA